MGSTILATKARGGTPTGTTCVPGQLRHVLQALVKGCVDAYGPHGGGLVKPVMVENEPDKCLLRVFLKTQTRLLCGVESRKSKPIYTGFTI